MRLAAAINEMEESLKDSGFPKQAYPRQDAATFGLGA
jgi:hypothetical protein